MAVSTIESAKTDLKDDITQKYQEYEKIINEEFKIWKKTVPLLYESIYSHVFEWPNLTVQWSPLTPETQGDSINATFLVGSHTSGNGEDYLKICSISLPKTLYDNSTSIDIPTQASLLSKVKVLASLPHPGEVNKARFNKSGSKIATLTNTGSVLIFDTVKHTLLYELKFHNKEGFGLTWSPHDDNQLLSGTEDKKIALWDLSKDTKLPVRVFETHDAVVNDISWNSKYPFLIASVSDDRTLQIHDLRSEGEEPLIKLANGHGNFDINAVLFHPEIGNLVVTAGSDNMINCYDLKNLTKPFRRLYGHTSSVSQLDFNLLNNNLLLSTGLDRRVLIWDFNKLDQGDVNEQEFIKNVNYNDPMLVFIHGGFTNTISECEWSPVLENVIIGCGEDCLLEIFKPSIIDDEDEEEDAEMESQDDDELKKDDSEGKD